MILTSSTAALAQKRITGTVTDGSDGEPLPGATILVTGTTVGAFTDDDGKFSLTVPDGQNQITVSYVGYKSETVDISSGTDFNIALRSDLELDQVIVIGYATQKKSDKTGAVTQVTSEELNLGRLSDPIQSMQGKAAGVIVSKQGGDPNSGFQVNIRGAAALTSGTGPLYVVDGVPGVDPTTLNPDDIESMNVLKDASSTAIYGSRGANGVIIITTKGSGLGRKESKQVNQVEYNNYFAFDQVANRLKFLDADQIRDFAQESGRTFIDNGANVDWQDEIYRSGISQLHTLSFSGADANSSYRASISANEVLGVMKGSGKERYIGRLNLSQRTLDDRLIIQGRMSATIEHNDYVSYGDGIAPNNVIYQAYRRSPTDPVFNADGSHFETDRSFQYFNPVSIIDDVQNERDAKRYLGNFRAELEILPGLKSAVNVGYIRDDEEKYYFEPSFTASNTTEGLARREYNNYESKVIETTVNYVKSLENIHNINVIAGHSYQVETKTGFKAEGQNAQSDYLKANNLQSMLLLEPGSITSYKNEALLASVFGRVVYDYQKRYFLTATLRRDGSSKFGKNNEWGTFPSLSMGWNLKKEYFMQEIDAISQLKLRLGYGISGNQNIDPNLDAVYYVPAGTAIDPETGEVVISFENSNDVNPNPDLRWEENVETNIGIDFGLFNARISGSIELYNKLTRGLIYKYELPVPPNKNRYIYANAGEIENRGIEVTTQAYVLSSDRLNWKTVVTFAHNKQKTTTLENGEYDLDELRVLSVSGRGLVGGENWTQIIRPGSEIGTFFLPEFAGFSEDGKFLFHTAAGGVTRDVTKAERRVVGSAQPDFTLGWSNYFDLGDNWDISFAWRAVVGHQILNVTRMVFSNPADLPTLNVLEEALDEYSRGLNSSPIVSSYYIEDASFLKLDNVMIGYTFDKIKSKYLKNLRLYASGTNLLVFTPYTGIDPELGYGSVEFGLDQYSVYPKTMSLTLGLKANF